MNHPSASILQKQRPRGRRISLLRHAKAAEDDGHGNDLARPLNARGREDAAKMGAWLHENHTLPELIVCSTARRTRETLAALHLSTTPTILTERAYLATAGELFALLQETDDAVQHVMLIGHNPGMHQLAALLTDTYTNEAYEDLLTVKFPTSTFVSMCVPAPHWKGLKPQSAELDALAIGNKL